jgi:thiamine kinase-like enzyme
MDDEGIGEARAALQGLKMFWCLDERDMVVTRLGGLTNRVFRVDHMGEQYVLRLPGKGTEEYINRDNELHAAKAAAKAGVSPDVVYGDAASGILITRLVDDSITMSPAKFRSIDGAPARAGEVLKRLHASEAQFNFRFELFAMIDEYLKVLVTKDAELPKGYHDVVKEAETVRAALKAHPLPLSACHCDPLCENFLDQHESRMWIVDWEYSGMNDPMWDLGDLSVEGSFTAAQEHEMISAYFGGEPTPTEHGRIIIYKAMCDLLWTLWGLIQHANQNPVDDFWAYSVNRFERCKTLMASPDFAGHVAAVRKG